REEDRGRADHEHRDLRAGGQKRAQARRQNLHLRRKQERGWHARSADDLGRPRREGFMMKASKTFVHQYADVAIVVGLLSTFGTWTVTRFVTASSAQPALAAAKPLLVQRLADLPGREVRITLLDRAPGSSSPPHRHPGHHTFGYVVEGTYEFAID